MTTYQEVVQTQEIEERRRGLRDKEVCLQDRKTDEYMEITQEESEIARMGTNTPVPAGLWLSAEACPDKPTFPWGPHTKEPAANMMNINPEKDQQIKKGFCTGQAINIEYLFDCEAYLEESVNCQKERAKDEENHKAANGFFTGQKINVEYLFEYQADPVINRLKYPKVLAKRLRREKSNSAMDLTADVNRGVIETQERQSDLLDKSAYSETLLTGNYKGTEQEKLEMASEETNYPCPRNDTEPVVSVGTYPEKSMFPWDPDAKECAADMVNISAEEDQQLKKGFFTGQEMNVEYLLEYEFCPKKEMWSTNKPPGGQTDEESSVDATELPKEYDKLKARAVGAMPTSEPRSDNHRGSDDDGLKEGNTQMTIKRKGIYGAKPHKTKPAPDKLFSPSKDNICQQDTSLFLLFLFTMVLLCKVARHVPFIKSLNPCWKPDFFNKFDRPGEEIEMDLTFSDKSKPKFDHLEDAPGMKVDFLSLQINGGDGIQHPENQQIKTPDHLTQHLDSRMSPSLEAVSLEKWPPDRVHLWLANGQSNRKKLEKPPDSIGLIPDKGFASSEKPSGINTGVNSPTLLTEIGELRGNQPGESAKDQVNLSHHPSASCQILVILDILDERHGPDQLKVLKPQQRM